MKMSRSTRLITCGAVASVSLVSLALGLSIVSCTQSNQLQGGTETDGGLVLPSSCLSATALTIVFAPVYSAYDGTHRFQVPAIVIGVDPTLVKWSSSDPAIATVDPDMVSGGAMITMTGAGTATIVAQAGNLCGGSLLTVDQATTDDWQQGSDRYNNGIVYSRTRPGMAQPDGSSNMDPACTNCHGPTAIDGRYTDVSHTPEQIGGFSDAVLQNIMQNAVVPDGGYFDTSIVSYRMWQSFHHWSLTDQDVKGVIVYLRSLTPAPQTGSSNFGGLGGRDGGFGPPRD